MENKKLVVGNFKMKMNARDINSYLKSIDKYELNKQVVICPTSIYLPYFLNKKYSVGIQNISYFDEGAYTGEISAAQVASMGVKYAIIGHSERRIYAKETDIDINKKIKMALNNKLKVILCIGESLEERDLLKTDRILKRQILNALSDIEIDMFKNIIIAYEPVWAIGTNKIPTNKEITDTVNFIKMIVNDHFKSSINVLYGGSINEKNIETLNKIDNLSGYLVGGASTDCSKFLKIIEVVVNQ